MMRTRSLLFTIAVTALLAATASCKKYANYFGKTEPVPGSVFRFDNQAEPSYLDPALFTSQPDHRLISLMFEGLTVTDLRTVSPAPGAADRWEVSSDGLTYRFHIRKGLVWSDGHPITARDFVYSWIRVLDPKTASQYASHLYHLVNGQQFNEGKIKDASQVGVRAIDDETLEARLRDPIPYFLFLTSWPTLSPVPAHTIEKYGSRWSDPANIVGNGAFRLTGHRTNAFFEFAPNPRYWRREEVKLEKIVAYSIPDLSTAANMYEAGMLDWLPSGSFPPEYVPALKKYRDLVQQPFLAIYFYTFNTTRPPFDSPLVRRALSMAIDRRAITGELLRGGQIPGANFVPVGVPGYTSPPGPEYNPQEAARLLAEAGYPNGKGFRTIEISFNTLESHKKVAEAMQQMWLKNLNVTAALHNEEFATFLKKRQNKDYDVAREGWIGDYPDASTFSDLMESTNGNNETGWKSAEYDSLLAGARRETDAAKRIGLLERAEAILLRESPILAIYSYAANALIKPYVRGFLPSPMDEYPLDKLWIDYDWQRHEVSDGARRD